MPILYIMVALPRSGKSTYVKKHLTNAVIVSADQLRLLIHGKRFFAKEEGKVWWVRNIMLQSLMEQGLVIVVDQTNTTTKRRKYLIDLAKKYNYKVVAVVIKTDKEVCKKRALDGGQEDLIPVIERMAKTFEPVTKVEGFDEIITIEN